MEKGSQETCLNGCHNALLLSAQATALFPAHGLEHATANIVTSQTIPGGLLEVPAGDSSIASVTGLLAPGPPPGPGYSHRGCRHATILPPLGFWWLRDSILLSAFSCTVPVLHLLKVCVCVCVREWGSWSLMAGYMGTDGLEGGPMGSWM